MAIACGPHRDIAVNPAKILAIGIADSNPIFWGGTVLAARAGRRIAESVRRATGRTALAADAEHLLPVLAAAAPADVFADPFADGGLERRPALVLLDDGAVDPAVRETRDLLAATAQRARACASRRSPRRPTATWPATRRCSPRGCTPRRTSSSASTPEHGHVAGPAAGTLAPWQPKVAPRPSWRPCWPTPASRSRSSSRSR